MESLQNDKNHSIEHSAKKCTVESLNLLTSTESVKNLLFLYIKLFLSMILLFQKLAVFARIKAEISGERWKIPLFTPGESRPESKYYKLPWTPGPIHIAPVIKINRI